MKASEREPFYYDNEREGKSILVFDDCQTTTQYLCSDTSADTLTFINLMMNYGYKYILSQLGRPVTEKRQTALTVASNQYYQLPPDYLFLKSITVTVGGIPYPVVEEESQEMWDIINANTTVTSDIPERYFIRPNWGSGIYEIGFYPAPASAGNTITTVYEASDRDLSVAKYTTGTVSVTNGSAAVTGSGTTFTAAMQGRYFQVTDALGDNLNYQVATYNSAISLTLVNVYQASTVSGVAYQIAQAFALPEEMQILPCYYAAYHYWNMKGNSQKQNENKAFFDEGLALGIRRHGTKSRSNITRGKKFISRFVPWAPVYFPSAIGGS